MANGIPYRVKITVDGDHIQFCLKEGDGEEVCPIQYEDFNTSLKTGKISLKVTSGAVYPTEVWFDNIVVKELETPQTVLDIPDLKQYSPPWGDKVYDQANIWAPANPSIKRWGCALTSAAMVLKYFNHDVWPDSLNDWLKEQPDGYLRNGLLNWLAISRYTKNNSNDNAPTLLFRRYKASDEILKEEIEQNRPPILKLPGHFVVAKGKKDSDFLVNDPASETNTLLSQVEADHGGSYSAINSYIPTSTDLSYIMLTIDPEVTLEVYDPNGEKLGDFYVDEPLTDDVDKTSTSGSSLGIFLSPAPKEGDYEVKVKGEGSYTLKSYLYNKEGKVETSSLQGLVGTNEIDNFKIVFGKENSNIAPIVTIDSLLKDLENARRMKLITHKTIYHMLRMRLKVTKFLLNQGKVRQAKRILKTTKLLINVFSPRFIKPRASDILTQNLQTLINSL